jgi:hypothetical protein
MKTLLFSNGEEELSSTQDIERNKRSSPTVKNGSMFFALMS